MAKFELTNVSIKKIERGQNAGKEYLAATLINTLAPWDAARSHVEFDERKIKVLKPFVPTSKGGTGAEDVELPDRYRFINGHYISWLPPTECIPFNRVYVTDLTTTLRNGQQVQHHAGEVICDQNGNPRLYSEVIVFCMYYIDPDFPGKPQYLRGNNPTEKGQAYFSTFCVAQNPAAKQPSTVVPEEDFGAITPTAQPAAPTTPIVPPGMKIVGYNPDGTPLYGNA